MKIKIKAIGIVRKYLSDTFLELSGNHLAIDIPELLNIPKEIRPIVLVNNKRVESNQKLLDGDEVKIVSLLMGG